MRTHLTPALFIYVNNRGDLIFVELSHISSFNLRKNYFFLLPFTSHASKDTTNNVEAPSSNADVNEYSKAIMLKNTIERTYTTSMK
jgi:hypothetical protein